jgi:hypothetical protein
MMLRARTLPAWSGLVAALVLVTRAVVYALARSTPLATRLSGRLGGPRPVLVTAVALAAGFVLAAAVLWLAALGVRERWSLADPATRGRAPRLELRRVALRTAGLWAASALAFATLESYVHWRAGLGFHGLSCLFGPVHVNALPVTAALALVAASMIGAVEHLLRWARRVVARALGTRPRPSRARVALVAAPPVATAPRLPFAFEPLLPRPPPGPALAS